MSRPLACSKCKRVTPRHLLLVKKALFTGMGSGAKTHRARVIAWLCPDCTKQDPDWNAEPYTPIEEKDMVNA